MREFAGGVRAESSGTTPRRSTGRSLIEAAIDGMVARKLDPYSTYLDDEEVVAFGRAVDGGVHGRRHSDSAEPGQRPADGPRPDPRHARRRGRAAGRRRDRQGRRGRRGGPQPVRRHRQDQGRGRSAPVTLGLLRPGSLTIRTKSKTGHDRAGRRCRAPSVVGDRRGAKTAQWDYLLPGEPKVGLIRVSRFGPRYLARDSAKPSPH